MSFTSNSKAPFVARAEETGFLESFIRESHTGSGNFNPNLFLIQAPSGAGKSYLVDECFSRVPEAVHMRVDLRQQQSYRGFRSEFLQALILHYRSMLRSVDDGKLGEWMWSAPRNRKSIVAAFSSIADGLTFGGLTAFKSLLTVVNSKTYQHIEELFAEQNQLEDWIEQIILELGKKFAIAVTVSNAQEISPEDLAYLVQICRKAQHFLTLEFTTHNFQHGVIDRERIASLTSRERTKVSALVLGPLKWEDAKEISQNLGDNDVWARRYYEQHGFNLFDLKHLSNPDHIEFQSACIIDLEFGPSVLPGIKNRNPATRQKIESLSKDQKLLICALYLHGGHAKMQDLVDVLASTPVGYEFKSITEFLVKEAELLKSGEQNQVLRFAHDSIVTAVEDNLALLPIIKIAAKQWQIFYRKRFDQMSLSGLQEPAFEHSIRLAYFSALIGSSDNLLDACQAIYKLSRYVTVLGDTKETFQLILDKVGEGSLIPKKIQPVIAYYLGASAINFQDYNLAREVLSTMEKGRFGANILSAFVHQKRDEFLASEKILEDIPLDADQNLSVEDAHLVSLARIINQHSLAKTARDIENAKLSFQKLVGKTEKLPHLHPMILKHASIGYGYQESIPMLKKAIMTLDAEDHAFESAQAKLVLLMQLTRLGKIDEATKLLSTIRDAFPKNFLEESNILNIEAILLCFSGKNNFAKSPRDIFQRAQRVCTDEYRKLVLASNIFVYDHFIDPVSPESDRQRSSREELVYLLETSTIGFRYLYVLGYYNLMRFYESIGDSCQKDAWQSKIGIIDDTDSLLWRCAMGLTDPNGTEVEFLVSTPYMLAFLPNYQVSPPSFERRVDKISEIISR